MPLEKRPVLDLSNLKVILTGRCSRYNMPMKITHVCQFLGVGGLEKVLHSLIKEQLKRGHEISLVVYDYDRRWVPMFKELGIEVIESHHKKDGYDWSLLKFLKRSLQDSDIVHTHDLNPMLYVGPLKLLRQLPRHTKLVHTTHGMEHLEESFKQNLYEMFLGVAAQKIVCVSEAFAGHYLSQLGTKQEKVELIENGTPLGASNRDYKAKLKLCSEFDFDPTKLVGVYVGRVCPMKGQLDLIKTFEREGRQLLIVGPPSDDEYYNKCSLSSGHHVRMTGSREDVVEILKGCDFFVSNSLHEGLPIAALEAGANGLPCYLSDIPGHRLFNKEADCVSLFVSLEELSSKIESHSRTSVPLSENLLNLIRRKYSSEAMEKKYNSVYEGLICSPN